MSHSSLQWQGWVPPRELAEQRRGVIPRHVMARLCHVRALNACARVREQVRVRGSSPQARRNPLEGGVSPRARRNPLEGGVSPRARWNPLEGGVSPRARQNLLEGAFGWAALMGRGGHRSVGRAVCACLGKQCVLFCFLQVLSRIPRFFRGPSGLSPTTLLRDETFILFQPCAIRQRGRHRCLVVIIFFCPCTCPPF
jgi:hypothetical protein